MTPQEKAQELVDKFNYESKHYLMLDAKQCALIAVDECIKHEKQIVKQIKSLQLPNSFIIINEGSFWEQVKHEVKTFKQKEQ
jgi:hypothetical protein